MEVRRDLFKLVLERLYNSYPDFVHKSRLSEDVRGIKGGKAKGDEITGVLVYLEDKGFIRDTESGLRIAALGIDKLELS